MVPKRSRKRQEGQVASPRRPGSSQDDRGAPKRAIFPAMVPHLGVQKGWLEGPVGPKNHQKAIQNAFKILIDFDVHFSSIFGRFGSDFGGVLEANLASKMLPRCIKNCTPILSDFFIDFFNWFYMDFSCTFEAPNPKSDIRMTLLALFAFSGKVVFEGLLDSILVPTWPHLGLQNPFKILPKSTTNPLKAVSKIWCVFLSIFRRFWKHLGTQVGPMLRPCWAQNPSKCDFRIPAKTNPHGQAGRHGLAQALPGEAPKGQRYYPKKDYPGSDTPWAKNIWKIVGTYGKS